MATIGFLFFVTGFVTWLNGPLILFVQVAFDLDEVDAFLVPVIFYISYFVFSLPASLVLRRTGLKMGLVVALLLVAAGMTIFGQFVAARIYPGLLGGLFVIGGGLSLLQTAINPYISIIGPIESAARRIALMGICNKTGGLLAPLILGKLVMRDIGSVVERARHATSVAGRSDLLSQFASRMYWPYLGMAAMMATTAYLILRSDLPDIDSSRSNRPAGRRRDGGLFSATHLWLGVLCLFLYVGIEVMAADAIGTYARTFGLPFDQTKFLTSATLSMMLLGYLVGFVVTPRLLSQERYLAGSALLGLIFVSLALVSHGGGSVFWIAMLGFANAMMWPAIFPLAIRGLGARTETGSALLIMGISGGAIIPQLFVMLKQTYDVQVVFWSLGAPIYAYIFFYALYGMRVPATAGGEPNAVAQ